MKPAFSFPAATPAAGPRILPGKGRGGAGDTTDARVAPLVERVHGNAVLPDVRPDVFRAPGSERIDLGEAEPLVPLEDASGGSLRGLVPADRAHPRPRAGQGRAQGCDLAQLAAAVRVTFPEAGPALPGLAPDRPRPPH